MTRTDGSLFAPKTTAMDTGKMSPVSTTNFSQTPVEETHVKDGRGKTTEIANNSMGLPSMRGSAYLLQKVADKTQRLRVVLSVHSTNFDCYLVVSSEKILCRDCGFINLKHCTVEKVNTPENSFKIVPRDGEGSELTFTLTKSCDLQKWLHVLQAKKTASHMTVPASCRTPRSLGIPKKSLLLPAVEEGPED